MAERSVDYRVETLLQLQSQPAGQDERGEANKDADNSNLPGRGEGENAACDNADDRDNGERDVDTHQLEYSLWVRIELSSYGADSILGGVEKPSILVEKTFHHAGSHPGAQGIRDYVHGPAQSVVAQQAA